MTQTVLTILRHPLTKQISGAVVGMLLAIMLYMTTTLIPDRYLPWNLGNDAVHMAAPSVSIDDIGARAKSLLPVDIRSGEAQEE
jgi:hypothetical protein